MIRKYLPDIRLKELLPKQLYFLFRLLVTGLVCLTIFRLMLLVQEFQQLQNLPEGGKTVLLLKAFLVGLRFDLVVSGYVLAIPFLLLTLDATGKWNSRFIYYVAGTIIAIGYVSTFFVCAADLPYMHHFHARASIAAFISVSSGSSEFLKGMVFQEWRYYWAIAPFLLISFYILRKQIDYLQRFLYPKTENLSFKQIAFFPLVAALLFMAVWGSLSVKGPIDNADAYTSNYSFTNQLGLSPMFTLGQSCFRAMNPSNSDVHFTSNEKAIDFVKKEFEVRGENGFESPIARKILFQEEPINPKPNVVLVMMESLSAHKMGRYGNPNNLTPFLDSLATQGLAFDNFFTTGIHTFAGIYSTLFSQPVIKRKHPLLKITPQSGIASTLSSHGYSTLYFTTHDEEFDNVGPFLRANGFQRIISKPDYPPEKVLSSLGVSDDYLYEHATEVVDDLYNSQSPNNRNPFFAVIMTGSDHGPYIIPDYYKPKQKKATQAIVEYVDWSVRKFLQEASEKEWFGNTIFVFVADHGATLDKRYDLPITYLHSPLIIYAPKILGTPRSIKSLASQLDIFPTLMGIIRLPYVNNTFGIDLFREQRKYAIGYADDKFAVLSREFMFLSRENGLNSLYNYPSGSVNDLSEKQAQLAQEMKTYGENMFQAAQYLVKSGNTKMPAAH